MFHDLCRIPPVAGSSKNRETPFREEIGFEALRTDGFFLLLPIPPKNRVLSAAVHDVIFRRQSGLSSGVTI